MTGWPDERKSVPEEIRGFWSYREEITADNGVFSNRIVTYRQRFYVWALNRGSLFLLGFAMLNYSCSCA